jgi:hypothetical protein
MAKSKRPKFFYWSVKFIIGCIASVNALYLVQIWDFLCYMEVFIAERYKGFTVFTTQGTV